MLFFILERSRYDIILHVYECECCVKWHPVEVRRQEDVPWADQCSGEVKFLPMILPHPPRLVIITLPWAGACQIDVRRPTIWVANEYAVVAIGDIILENRQRVGGIFPRDSRINGVGGVG